MSARDHLERQGYPCYFPTFMAEKMRYRRIVVKQEPLFPRYLFIHLDELEDNWYPTRFTITSSSRTSDQIYRPSRAEGLAWV